MQLAVIFGLNKLAIGDEVAANTSTAVQQMPSGCPCPVEPVVKVGKHIL